MAINLKLKNNFVPFTACCLLLISGLIHSNSIKPKPLLLKQDTAININSTFLKLFSAGQNRLISDFLWISTLLESDTSHYQQKDLSSWMYLRFKSIVDLDPKFLSAYDFGGKYLSIVKDDLHGAKDIFKQGLLVYPNNYDLLFNYGFLLGFELLEYKEAVPIYKRLMKNPKAPQYIKTLVLKIEYQATRDLKSILPLIRDMYHNEPNDSYLKNRLKLDLYAIQTEIDLSCLNNKFTVATCNRTDIDGNRYYMNKSGDFVSKKKFNAYKLQKK